MGLSPLYYVRTTVGRHTRHSQDLGIQDGREEEDEHVAREVCSSETVWEGIAEPVFEVASFPGLPRARKKNEGKAGRGLVDFITCATAGYTSGRRL